ncbi:MAG: type II secretion system protein [Proteobacteria bacterium]|nr:type II secretion system protein [Pseudomonadota bacterium]
MPKRNEHGFTLVELMIVVVIIGVFSALAIPGITRVMYRNTLSEMVNEMQQLAIETRALAMQTRRAAVLEVDPNAGALVHLLPSSNCADATAVAQRCVYEADLTNASYVTASATMCPPNQLLLSAANPPVCSQSGTQPTGPYALCYSGRGELYIRAGADANTTCAATTAPSNTATWSPVCDLVVEDPTAGTLTSGVAIPFNRYAARDCTETAEDVQRVLFVPKSGAPYSKVGQ